MKRVVITGMGIYSCIGKNLDEVKDSLYHGKSGIGIDPVRKELGYFSALTGILQRPDLKKLLDRRKRLCLPERRYYHCHTRYPLRWIRENSRQSLHYGKPLM